MGKLALLIKYQRFDPDTGRFDYPRTNREYADMLGVHESTLSKFYALKEPVGLKALEGLAHAFPQAQPELGPALAQARTEALRAQIGEAVPA